MGKMNYDFLECVKKMPPLAHTKKDSEFDIHESEAAKWMVGQPEILQKVFDMARYHGVIRFDSVSGTWKGVDYHGD